MDYLTSPEAQLAWSQLEAAEIQHAELTALSDPPKQQLDDATKLVETLQAKWLGLASGDELSEAQSKQVALDEKRARLTEQARLKVQIPQMQAAADVATQQLADAEGKAQALIDAGDLEAAAPLVAEADRIREEASQLTTSADAAKRKIEQLGAAVAVTPESAAAVDFAAVEESKLDGGQDT